MQNFVKGQRSSLKLFRIYIISILNVVYYYYVTVCLLILAVRDGTLILEILSSIEACLIVQDKSSILSISNNMKR